METNERLGLALSGGGFRASFFHIGVLAQLARRGLLRHVELISTVSGGSVVGALYYLHVKKLLEEKRDADVTAADYVGIVQSIEKDFLAAVQRNVRLHIFADPLKNLRMSMSDYSRSDRIGELYDAFFYRPVTGGDRPVELRELKIHPVGEPEDFHPLRHNSTRRNKVPVLMINATTLNTGENWRFEASRMGEPPRESAVRRDIDKNPRLGPPPSYEDLPAHQQDFDLGTAVAASTAVPGVFHPLSISRLYPDLQVQLVDGGVHDNQGVQALLDRNCSRFVISDASGQMAFEPHPSTGIANVVLRTNAIFMSRLRGEQLVRVMESEEHPSTLLHLRKGLVRRTIYPRGVAPEPLKEAPPDDGGCEAFGVHPEVQQRLARIRTDLDAFSDVEAHSLMMNAYLMSDYEFSRTAFLQELERRGSGAVPEEPSWTFAKIRPLLANPTPEYLRQLDVAADAALKAFRVNPALTAAVTAVVLTGLGFALITDPEAITAVLNHPVRFGELLVGAAVLGLAFLPGSRRWLNRYQAVRSPLRFARRLLVRALPALAVTPVVWLYLWLGESLFLSRGRVERLLNEEE